MREGRGKERGLLSGCSNGEEIEYIYRLGQGERGIREGKGQVGNGEHWRGG